METPKIVNSLTCIATCTGITIRECDKLMENTTKANGSRIRKLIKKHLPELYKDMGLKYYNPFECRSVKKKNLLVYNYSAVEYFLQYT